MAIRILLLNVLLLININAFATDHTVTEQDGYQIASKFLIKSKILDEDREFFVSLPNSYQKGSSNYPVLLLLDGAQNLEHSVASARMLSAWKGIPEIIIVAIPSKNRVKDFTPTKDIAYSIDSGGAEKFANFIEQEVMSVVDKKFRTHPFRILEGHSLGGVFAANQFLSKSDFYNAYIIISPALWWDNYYIANKLKQHGAIKASVAKPIYLGIGEQDGFGMKQDIKEFYEALLSNENSNEDYAHKVYDGEGHMSATLPSMYDGLQHIFKGAKYQESLWPNFSSESFTQFIQKTKQLYGSSVTQTGELFIQLSQFLIDKEDYSGAITVLKTNIESYPNYPFNHDELANAYALNDQPKLAIEEYKKAAKYARESSSFGDGVAKKYEAQIAILNTPVIYSTDKIKSFIGCYISESGTVFKITTEQNKLMGWREEWGRFKLFADKGNTFFMRTQPKLRFEFKDNTLDIEAYGQVYHYKKNKCG